MGSGWPLTWPVVSSGDPQMTGHESKGQHEKTLPSGPKSLGTLRIGSLSFLERTVEENDGKREMNGNEKKCKGQKDVKRCVSEKNW